MKTVYVHNGIFHLDDVLCGVMAKIVWPDCTIIRIDHQSEFITDEIINSREFVLCDVGRHSNAQLLNFDHHQDQTLKSAALQFWESYNEVIIDEIIDLRNIDDVSDYKSFTKEYVYTELLNYVDVQDNNRDEHNEQIRKVSELVTAARLISILRDDTNPDKGYFDAVEIMTKLFIKLVNNSVEAYRLVKVYDDRSILDYKNIKVIFINEFVPIYNKPAEDLDFVVYKDSKHSGLWKIQARSSDFKPLIVPAISMSPVFYHVGDFLAIFKTPNEAYEYLTYLDNHYKTKTDHYLKELDQSL